MADYHRRREAAKILEVSEWTVKRWMSRGLIGVSRVDGCVWVDVDDARALIAAGRIDPVAGAQPARAAPVDDLSAARAYFARPTATASPQRARRRV